MLTISILRVKCSVCGKTHAILPSTVVPYSQVSLHDHITIIVNDINKSTQIDVMSNNPLIDENMNDFSSLNELSSSLIKFVNKYNKTVHSSLNGKTPEDRFFEEGCLIKRLSDETIETSFLLEYERRVSADNVIVINETVYTSIFFSQSEIS